MLEEETDIAESALIMDVLEACIMALDTGIMASTELEDMAELVSVVVGVLWEEQAARASKETDNPAKKILCINMKEVDKRGATIAGEHHLQRVIWNKVKETSHHSFSIFNYQFVILSPHTSTPSQRSVAASPPLLCSR